jgi:hypothetical protein
MVVNKTTFQKNLKNISPVLLYSTIPYWGAVLFLVFKVIKNGTTYSRVTLLLFVVAGYMGIMLVRFFIRKK